MSGAGDNGENSDEEYYVDESFEEDSQSEVEEQEEEAEDEEVEEEDVEVEEQDVTDLLLDESDTQSESDVEAEFLRGNPHARRQQMMSNRSNGGFNRDRMMTYPSSSDDEESQVVITKTVAEVNQLSLRLDTPQDDETPSVRTLVPGSAHAQTEDDDEDDDDVEEVEEVEEEEEVEEDDDGAQSDGTMASNHGHQSAEDSDEDEATDVEVEPLEEDEPVVMVTKERLPQEDLVSLVDASDNSSDQSAATIGKAGAETDVIVADASPRFQMQVQHPEPSTEPVTVIESNIEEQQPVVTPVVEPVDTPLKRLNSFLDNSDPSVIQQHDVATVKYLEQQMTQMSEMIMKTFRINGGATNSQAFEQLAMATELMQQHSQRRGESESEMASITESALTSARSCGGGGGGRSPMRLRYQRSQEALITTRSSMLPRPKCRCPSESELLQQEQQMGQGVGQELLDPGMELGMGMEQGYLMDECGQGDGLMRHPPQCRPPEFNRRVASSTPSSFTSDGRQYPINVSRSRCSNDKVNYKNLGRKSFTFTNVQVREIERQNQILLRKMMTVKPTATIKASTSSMKLSATAPEKHPPPPVARLTSAAVNRKKYQRQIDLDNDVLKRKLEAIGTRRSQFK